ncbi:MAG: hypothetical protein ACFFD2_06290 [Promethearchaeota archaeon]
MPKIEVIYFEKAGPDNTMDALQIAKSYAEKNGINNIICASTTGTTGIKLIDIFDPEKFNLIIITHADGFIKIGHQELLPENREKLQGKAKILTSIHAFSGISRSFRKELKVYTPVEIIARMLRSVFGDGLKVCIEITLMAADAGLIFDYNDVLAIAGTGKGADTVALIRPAYTTNFLNLRVKQILCKPNLW